MRPLLYIFLIPLFLIQWALTLLQNLFEVAATQFEEISLALENFITHNAKTKPVSEVVSDESDK